MSMYGRARKGKIGSWSDCVDFMGAEGAKGAAYSVCWVGLGDIFCSAEMVSPYGAIVGEDAISLGGDYKYIVWSRSRQSRSEYRQSRKDN
jgi:hypothetical protein